MGKFWDTIVAFFQSSGVVSFFTQGLWLNLVMIAVACVLLFLAIKKDFEPYLLLPIAFGMLLINLPQVGQEIFQKGATTYNAISLAAELGLEKDFVQANIFGTETILTTKQLNDIVLVKGFASTLSDNTSITLAEAEKIVEDIQHLYSYDYNGIFGFLYYGVKWGIYPCLIFLCIGATTDFGPLIAFRCCCTSRHFHYIHWRDCFRSVISRP